MSMQAVSNLVLISDTPLRERLMEPDYITVLSQFLRTVLKCEGFLLMIYFHT